VSPVARTRFDRRVAESVGEGAPIVTALVAELLDGVDPAARTAEIRPLKPPRVYRWVFDPGVARPSVILKRLDRPVAGRVRLVAERWLPALDLGDRCARLLGFAAEPDGEAVWHAYEDLGDLTLADARRPVDVRRTVDLVACLHTRAAGHDLLVRASAVCPSLAMAYFDENVREAVRALERLTESGVDVTAEGTHLVERLHRRLVGLRRDAERRAATFSEVGWPDTLVHGDVWPVNVSLSDGQPRLVDWDKVGVGPASYDLSAFLMRFRPDERTPIVERYLGAVARAGWTVPSTDRLETMLDTHERARYANRVIWPARALIDEPLGWGLPELREVERWFESLDTSPVVEPADPGRAKRRISRLD